MYTLIIDSATKILYMALVKDDIVLSEKYITSKEGHSKAIVYEVDEMLKSNNITSCDLDKVISGVGPGSYTGVRMGVVVCKTIATLKGIDLYSISTLKLMASSTLDVVCPLIDARRQNSFACIYDPTKDLYIEEEGVYNTQEITLKCDFKITEDNFKVNPLRVIHLATKVEKPHLLVPNYLKETEAERNLNANT